MYELLIAVVPSFITAMVTILVMKEKNNTNLKLAQKQYEHELAVKDKEHENELEKLEQQNNMQTQTNNEAAVNDIALKVMSGELDLDSIENLAKRAQNSPFNKVPTKGKKRK